MRRDLRTLGALCLGALAAAAAAHGATGLELKGVDAEAYPEVRASLVAPAGAAGTPTLTENGRPVAGLAAENLGRGKSIVLAVDRSRSMRGGALEDATAAARAFVAAKRPNDRIAVVAFGSRAVQLTAFSTSTIDADSVLRSLAVDGRQGTALYDAVALGAAALSAEAHPGRVVVVLTDGRDVSSSATFADAARAARSAGASVYPIAIESVDFSPAPLRRIADSTGGSYRGASQTGALAAVYADLARELSRTWRLSYTTAARPGERLRLDATLGGATASVSTVLPGVAPAGAPGPSPLLPPFVYEYGLGAFAVTLLVGALAFLAVLLVLALPAGAALRSRLEPHLARPRQRVARRTPRERFSGANAVMGATEKAFSHLRQWQRVHRLIERADLPLRTVEFLYICAGGGLLLGLVVAATGAASPVIVLAMGIGGAAPVVVAWWRARKRMNAFEDQLPDLLIGLAASLKAGHSFRQGVQAVVDEGHPPASEEFKRVLTETRLGRPMDDALAEMAERVGSKNLKFVITAVTIQRQVGGSLAGIFDMVADAVRQRQQFARKIRSLTATGRMSAYVLLGLPFFMAGTITLMNPEYMDPLYSTPTGHKLILGGLVMMALGSVLLKKIVSFRG